MAEWPERLGASMRNSQTLRLLTVAVLVLLLLIPIGMIRGLVAERQERQATAVAEVSSKWGGIQDIVGPYLVVPYSVDIPVRTKDDAPAIQRVDRHAVFLAQELTTVARLTTETRTRGIYSVPVYAMDLRVSGTFVRPDFSLLGITPAAVDWDRVTLVLGVADTRAIQAPASVNWGEMQIAMMPGSGSAMAEYPGIHAVVSLPQAGNVVRFSLPISLNGSAGLYFAPFGETTVVKIDSNYPHPSFQGGWLPGDREVHAGGFHAEWSIPFLGRSFPQAWEEGGKQGLGEVAAASRFGVDFVDPVDHYSMAERSVKYAGLFILLTFATLWLFEVRAAVRVHPIQFLMLGGALCLFYLLLLSLSEHLPFLGAYGIASVAVIGMVCAYGMIVLGTVRRAVLIGSVVALLYGYLYVLLVNEDYALLIGSSGLFLMLAVLMYATRKVDWYAVGTKPQR